VVPPGLVELRENVAKIIEDSERISDVDIRPLAELEARKDYSGAVALVDRAIAQNSLRQSLAASLLSAATELLELGVEVRPDAAGTEAITAFSILVKLAQTEKRYYDRRHRLYETTRGYYADLTAKKNPPIPPALEPLVEEVNAEFKRVKSLRTEFAAAIRAFDATAAGR